MNKIVTVIHRSKLRWCQCRSMSLVSEAENTFVERACLLLLMYSRVSGLKRYLSMVEILNQT